MLILQPWKFNLLWVSILLEGAEIPTRTRN